MSNAEEKENTGHQGRQWKVEAIFKDYEPAKSLSERLAASGLESKVKRKAVGFTVRTRELLGTSPTEPKSKRKSK